MEGEDLHLAGRDSVHGMAMAVIKLQLISSVRLLMAWPAGTVHVPADQLPAALKMAPRDWETAYRSPKPSLDDWLVMQCRTNKRASWAAQIAQDQGWPRVLVHREVRFPIACTWAVQVMDLHTAHHHFKLAHAS